MSPSAVLSAARAAYAIGLAVLPVCDDGSKRPDVSSWTEFKTTRPTVAHMRAWGFATRAGFGIIGGEASGRLDPWDFDDAATFEDFVAAAHGCGLGSVVARIRAGYEDRTPTGGWRWLVRYPEGESFADVVLAQRPPDVVLIEITTFSILAPSNGGTHPSGRPYTRISGDFATIASYNIEEREALFELARSFNERPRRTVAPSLGRQTHARARPGDVFNARMTWPQLLEPRGWTAVYTRGDVTYWRRPGKTHGVSATTNHAGSDLLYVFTSSTSFESETSYSKFGAYAVLDHGGDYAAAARALAQLGFEAPASADADQAAPASDGEEKATTGAASTDSARAIRLTAAAQIRVRPVRWLWKDRLSLGTLSLVGGREGQGKTLLADTLAADVTRGRLPGVYFEQPRAVLIAATEDSWEHTIVPRLMAADADLTRVFRVDVVASDGGSLSLSLPQDVMALGDVARDVDAALVILDPLLSRLDARLDTHKDAEVRRALEPLSAVANDADLTVAGVIHVNKSASSDALNLLMGSRAFPSVARNVLFVMADPEDERRRLLGQAKNNLGRTDLPMLAFTVENTMVANTEEGSVWTGKLRWQTPSTRTLRDVIEQTGTRTADQTAVQEAAAWLETYLVGQQGRALVAKAISLGEDAGHSRATLYKAKTRLGLQSESENTFPFRSVWVRQVVDVSVDAVSRAVEPETSTPTAAAASANYPVETPETPETTVGARRGGVVVSAPTTPETTTTETTVALDRIEALLATGARNVRETAEALTTDDLPECLADLTAPDHSDPVGQHDLEDLDPVATRGGGRGEDPASAGRLCGKVMHTSYGGNTLRCLAEADASGFCPVHRSPASVVASRRSTRTPAFKKQRLPSTGDDGDA